MPGAYEAGSSRKLLKCLVISRCLTSELAGKRKTVTMKPSRPSLLVLFLEGLAAAQCLE